MFRAASAGTLELLDTKVLASGAVIRAYGPISSTAASATEGNEDGV